MEVKSVFEYEVAMLTMEGNGQQTKPSKRHTLSGQHPRKVRV